MRYHAMMRGLTRHQSAKRIDASRSVTRHCGLTGPRVGAVSPGRSARLPVQEDVVGVFEDAAQVAGVVVEEFGDREDVDGDSGGVVLGAARGDEDGGQLDLFGHAPEVALAVLGDQVAAIGHGAGGLLFLHANTPSALHARDVRGCREVQSRLQTVGVFP